MRLAFIANTCKVDIRDEFFALREETLPKREDAFSEEAGEIS